MIIRTKLSASALKYIAIAAMTIDHIAFVFVPTDTVLYYVMRLFGRLTAPIMSFFISEGFIHTSSRKKYLLRLFLFAVISQPFYFIMIFSRLPETAFEYFTNLNVMFTFCLSLMSLIILTSEKIHTAAKIILIGICFAAADFCDWSYIIPAWTIIFFLFRNSKKQKNAAFIGVSVLILIQRFLPLYDSLIQFSCQLGVILSLIPLNLYNGKHSGSSGCFLKSFNKWAFYIYYPLHMSAILLILNIDKLWVG